MSRAVFVMFACLLAPTICSGARAFSDPDLFAQPAERGGGAGRHFTGSPSDGHSCSVCHRGGIEPQVTILGLPHEFEVGRPYDITVRWDRPDISHGLHLELLTAAGESPQVELPATEALTAGARCESAPDGDPAVYSLELDRRRILGVRDCGASELSFRFVGPASTRIALAASIVRSDSSGTAEGDGVFDLRRIIYARGHAPRESGCALAASRSRSLDLSTLALPLIVLARRKKRRSFAPARAGRSRWASSLIAACSLWLLSCYQPAFSADYRPRNEPAFDATLALPVDAASPLPSLDAHLQPALDAQSEWPDAHVTRPTQLTFRVLTAPVGGRYAPRNIGAIWVEDTRGAFVKTLARWALTRAMYLRRFQAASKGDLTDAVTSATLGVHELHEVSWNLRGPSGLEVSDGSYRLVIELTDRDATGIALELPFVKGPDTLSFRPEDTAQFRSMELVLR